MLRPTQRIKQPHILLGMGRHLVYSEGTKTEPFYVQSFKNELEKNRKNKSDRAQIIFKHFRESKHTVDLVKRAESDVALRLARGEHIDAVWLFFDRDSFDDFDDAYQRIVRKRVPSHSNAHGMGGDENDIAWVACWSNECFEVWVYLHFEDLSSQLPRKDYIPKINGFIKARGHKGHYEKNKEELMPFLIECGGDMKKAIQRAKNKIRNIPDDEKRPNPSTGVYQFAEFFSAYL